MTKTFAEHCLILDINYLIKKFRETNLPRIFINWDLSSEGGYSNNIEVIKDIEDPDGTIFRLKLKYTINSEERNEKIETPIRLINRPCHLGGKRYLFECPKCFEYGYKLYLLPAEDIFLCRKCCNLTYFSKSKSYSLGSLTIRIEKIDEKLKNNRIHKKTREKLILERKRLKNIRG